VAGAEVNRGYASRSARAPRDRSRLKRTLPMPQQRRNPSIHLPCHSGVAGAEANRGHTSRSARAPRDRSRLKRTLPMPQQRRNPAFHLQCAPANHSRGTQPHARREMAPLSRGCPPIAWNLNRFFARIPLARDQTGGDCLNYPQNRFKLYGRHYRTYCRS
jgi:hypothetical protein